MYKCQKYDIRFVYLTKIEITFLLQSQNVHLDKFTICRTILAWIVGVERMADRLMTVWYGCATLYNVPRVNGRNT